jgi:TolB protein
MIGKHRIEFVLIGAFIFTIGILLLGFAPARYLLITVSGILSLLWLISSFRKKVYGDIPLYGFIFSIPLALMPLAISFKLAIIPGGAFLLFLGLVLAVIGIAALFFLILGGKNYLRYLKNVSVRLIPATALGIIIYFTPLIHFIELVYRNSPEKINELKTELLYPYKSKTQKSSIIFVSDRAGNTDILEINVDGTGLKALVSNEGGQWSPRANVQGDQLYFLTDENGENALMNYNLKTDSISFVRPFVFDDFYFQLHPDNDKLICHDTINGFYQIFIRGLRDSLNRQITSDSSNHYKPQISSDGKKVFYQGDATGNDDIYMLFLEKDSVVNLTSHLANDRNPSLSPYDDVIVFNSDRDTLKRQNLFYLIIGTGEIGQLTDSPGFELAASFSPNAKDLVFGSNRDGNWEIYLMSNKGEFKDRLTNHPGFDGDAIWINRAYIKK